MRNVVVFARDAVHALNLEPAFFQLANGLLGVRTILGFDHDIDERALRRYVEIEAPMIHLQNVRAAAPDLARDLTERSRPVADCDAQRYDFALAFEPAHDDGSQHAGVDVGPALEKPNTAPRKAFLI